MTRTWQPRPWISNPILRWALILGGLLYLGVAFGSIEINFARIQRGFERLFETDTAFQWGVLGSKTDEVLEGILESLTMAVVATPLGILLSIPVGFGAARNVSPIWIYVFCRAIAVTSRGFHEIVIAILFVIMVGFGPFAGVLTLAFATIGFFAKLLAEEIEETDPEVLDAMRATGASWLQRMVFGILPQIRPRLIGLSLYRFDINLRESTVIGLVGAGGIGATLKTTFERYEYLSSAAILLIIILIVFALEIVSGTIRRKFL
ncbi:MAG: phosphonate transport system permease protein [Verrucomicrobiales bacterium]|jgi:phosphonate transport system permease protein